MTDDTSGKDRETSIAGTLGGSQKQDQQVMAMQGVSEDPSRGNWMQVYPALKFWPLAPKAADVRLETIVQALCCKARYAGHSKWPIWVAQHAVYVAKEVLRRTNGDPLQGLVALHHDDNEAYLPDIPRPLKADLPGWYEIEARVDRVIWEHFGFNITELPPVLREVDNLILFNEGRDGMVTPINDWHMTFSPGIPNMRVESISYSLAKQRYLSLHERLMWHQERGIPLQPHTYSYDHMGR